MAPHRPLTDEEDDDDDEEGEERGVTTTTDQSFDHRQHHNHHLDREQQQPEQSKMIVEGQMQQSVLSSGEEEEEEAVEDEEERKSEDDELTSLTWLQNRNLLQTCISGSNQSNGVGILTTSSVHGSYLSESPSSSSSTTSNGRELSPSSSSSTRTTSEVGVHQRGGSSSVVSLEFYNPTVHVCTKPPYSFSCLIFMAIEDSPNCALPVKDIYSWILSRFPYFQNAPTGWKNSVRHNLSLNKCFLKVDKGQNIAKGSLWCVDPEYRPNLIQALRKTPYNPYHHIQLPSGPRIATKLSSQNPIIVAGNGCTPTTNLPNPDLFPFLSKRLAASAMKDPEVDAAATMLALKNGPHVLENSGLSDCVRIHGSRSNRVISPIKERRERRIHEKLKVKIGRSIKPQPLSVRVPVITVSPTEDHTYSSTNSPTRHTTSDSPSSSIDEPFEFGGEGGVGGGGGGGVLLGQLSPRNRALLLTGHNGDGGDSGGDSGVTRSNTSESDEEYTTSVVREFAEVIKEESSPYETMTPRVTPVRCPVIVRTVTTTSGHCKVMMDDEEQQKIVDGADALLNLAGIRTHANEASVIRKRGKARRKRKLSRRHLRHLVPADEAHR